MLTCFFSRGYIGGLKKICLHGRCGGGCHMAYKDDNKNKTKTPFSENSSFQEKYTHESQFFFY